jgi:hypothetical protein
MSTSARQSSSFVTSGFTAAALVSVSFLLLFVQADYYIVKQNH